MERVIVSLLELALDRVRGPPIPPPTVMEKAISAVITIPVPNFISQRTGLELACLSSMAAYAVWQVARNNIHSKAMELSPKVIPGATWLRRHLSKTKFVSEKSVKTSLESRVDGSEERDMTPPKFQARIGIWKDADFVCIGNAVRYGFYLIAPDHVIGGDDSVEKYVYGKKGYLSLVGRERIILDTDLAIIQMTSDEFSRIGLAESSTKTLPDYGTFVNIVGPLGQGTAADLKHDPHVFGRIVYNGTTLPGYSGSAYMMAGGIVGIHQTGGRINSGFNFEYIVNLLHIHLKTKQESSKKWLEAQYAARKTLRWETTGDPDVVQIRVNGKYVVVDRETMDEAFGTSWADDHEIRMKTEHGYKDYESAPISLVSGESKPVNSFPGVSTGLENQGGQNQPNHQHLIEMYRKLSKQQKTAFRKSLGQSPEPVSIINGPVKMDK